MGYCKDCSWAHEGEGAGLGRIWCYHLDDDKMISVSKYGSCDDFSQKSTRESKNYKENSSGCFLTSACVDYLGKSDNCAELTALRKFRDEYMKSFDEGRKLVKEYYEVAPIIVDKINESEKKEKYYQEIYLNITDCIKLIDETQKEQAMQKYCDMVQRFKKEFAL